MSTPTDPLITVTVKQQPVTEGNKTYLKGQTLKVTAKRQAELGDFVFIPDPPKAKEAAKPAPAASAPEKPASPPVLPTVPPQPVTTPAAEASPTK